jgi:hypothetical protein
MPVRANDHSLLEQVVKQQYPVRHPPVPEAARRGETTSAHDQSTVPDARPARGGAAGPRVEPQLPHEQDESSRSQASATPQHAGIGKRAYQDATGASEDTDRGPVLDEVYNDKVAPNRSAGRPRE